MAEDIGVDVERAALVPEVTVNSNPGLSARTEQAQANLVQVWGVRAEHKGGGRARSLVAVGPHPSCS